ncbi:MAG: hypothetical protein AAF741_05220 [Bacteroidota bacterium]
MPVLTLTLLSVAFLISLFVLFRKLSEGRMPGPKKRSDELQKLQTDMDSWAGKLVPIGAEELDLFSLSQSKQVVKTGASTSAKGLFTTIFQEPILAYSYKRYLGKKVNDLLYARAAEHEYVYWTENGTTKVQIDGQQVGELRDRTIFGQRTGQPLAQIAKQAKNNYLPIEVGGREVGGLSTEPPAKEQSLKQKALEFIPPDLTEKEEQLMLALITRELVLQSIPKKK